MYFFNFGIYLIIEFYERDFRDILVLWFLNFVFYSIEGGLGYFFIFIFI